MREGGNDTVSLGTQFVVGLQYGGMLVVIDPFAASYSDVFCRVESVMGLNHMDILYAEAVATA